MANSQVQTCPVCGVQIVVGMVGGDRVLFSTGPAGDRGKLYERVCRYVDKSGCINKNAASNLPHQP
jgi:hypothetical protein